MLPTSSTRTPDYKFVRISGWRRNNSDLSITMPPRFLKKYDRKIAPKDYIPIYLRDCGNPVTYVIPRTEIRENWANLPKLNSSGFGSLFIKNSFLVEMAKKSFPWWELYMSLGGVLEPIIPPNGINNLSDQLTLNIQNEEPKMAMTYIVGSSHKPGALSISNEPNKHGSLISAKTEAKRLADQAARNNSSTKRYIVLQVVAVEEVEQNQSFDF